MDVVVNAVEDVEVEAGLVDVVVDVELLVVVLMVVLMDVVVNVAEDVVVEAELVDVVVDVELVVVVVVDVLAM